MGTAVTDLEACCNRVGKEYLVFVLVVGYAIERYVEVELDEDSSAPAPSCPLQSHPWWMDFLVHFDVFWWKMPQQGRHSSEDSRLVENVFV